MANQTWGLAPPWALGNNQPMSFTPPNSTPSGNAPTQAAKGVGGRRVTIIAFLILMGIAIFTYFVVPMLVTPYLRARPAELQASFGVIEAALRAYHADHGVFPPREQMLNHRRPNKNLTTSRAYGINAYRLASLTTPVAYLDPNKGPDPYAMPEQFAPPGYATGLLDSDSVAYALLFSPGPNLRYDIRNIEIEDLTSLAAIEDAVARRTYDPTNGARSGGDLPRLVIIPLQSARP